MSAYDTITYEVQERVATITLNRPDRLNGITNPMLREVHHALSEAARDSETTVLVLTGAGKGFCPGADLQYYAGAVTEPSKPEYFQAAALLHEMSKVTIAAVNGACAGAGLTWAAACDLRYAAATATFNSAFLGVAISGDMGGPWTLPRILGAARARELYFLPGKFGADEAARIGLVSRVFPEATFRDEVRGIAGRIGASAPLALRAMKANFITAEHTTLRDYLAIETEHHQRTGASEDSREAFRAFVEKRPALFQGR
jgi:2-(1,2-epoxy-1,2-dihydrophenyl)acetyl-CoA isomerase